MKTVTIFIALIGIPLFAHTQDIGSPPRDSQDLLLSHTAILEQLEASFADSACIFVESMKWANSKARVGRVMGLVNAPIDRVWEIVTDYRNYTQLIPRCTRSLVLSPEIIATISDSKSIPSSRDISDNTLACPAPRETTLVYSEVDIIFPIGRIRSLLEMTSDSTDFTIYWRKLASDIRIHEGVCQFVPSGDQTVFVCTIRYRLNVWLPPFIIHAAVHHYLPQIIMALRQRVSEEP